LRVGGWALGHWAHGALDGLGSFWKEGEPNDAGNEDCVELAAEDWNDSRCAAQNFWVCERPSAPCPGA
uniref:C-type lectin domain-containing protein n=1 Tax=Sciurus vulgaris TaxID=55149 RepID=A0A8D2DA90_SCIVU